MGGILRLTILKIESVLKFSDVGALKRVNRARAIRAKPNVHLQNTGGASNVLHLKLTKKSSAKPLEMHVNTH